MPIKLTEAEAISRLTQKYPTYGFSNFKYLGQQIESEVTCPIHGQVYRSYKDALRTNSACPKCSPSLKSSEEDFLSKLKIAYPTTWDKYDYSKMNYLGAHVKVKIICPTHGLFEVKPNTLLGKPSHTPCAKCNIKIRSQKQSDNLESFLGKILEKDSNFIISEVATYLGSKELIAAICREHGPYQIRPNDLMSGRRCPRCSMSKKSGPEYELYDFVKSLIPTVLSRVRLACMDGKELDIFVPELNLAIEYNGLIYHRTYDSKDLNRLPLSPTSLLQKTELCNKNNIRLIHIFEDEWLKDRALVEGRLRSILGKSKSIFARNCEVRALSLDETRDFEKANHIQGPILSKYRYGLFFQDTLVASMSFSGNRFEENKAGEFELLRFCSLGTVTGGFSKLLNKFIKDISPSRIVSYSDRRWSLGKVYEINGFTKIGTSTPGYFWCKNQTRWNRITFQKHKLKNIPEIEFKDELTEKEMMFKAGYFLIHDCGQDKWEMKL